MLKGLSIILRQWKLLTILGKETVGVINIIKSFKILPFACLMAETSEQTPGMLFGVAYFVKQHFLVSCVSS